MRRFLAAVVLALSLGLAGPAGAAEVLEFGDAPDVGQPPLTTRVVGAAATPSGAGYWTVGADGAITAFGDARHVGDAAGMRLARPIVGMAATPTGGGYWLVATDGGIFTYGDAVFFGSTGALRLVSPIVGMATTPTGAGYWLVAGDGGIFTFGDARFHGSTGAMRLNRPVVGMAGTPTGRGYWLTASDGGIFTFGDARFFGSTGALRLVSPVVGMTATPSGAGYRLVAADGGLFTFGDAGFAGSAAQVCTDPVIAMVPSGGGYWIVASPLPRPSPPPGTHPLDVLAAESAEVEATLRARQRCHPVQGAARGTLSAPLRGGRPNGGFGPRTHPIYRRPQLHTGTDLVGGDGVVRAASDGVVVSVENRAGYGIAVVVDHGGNVATLSAHLSRASVGAGQTVRRGDALGSVGATGFATGPHLHFEVRSRGVPVDPAGWL